MKIFEFIYKRFQRAWAAETLQDAEEYVRAQPLAGYTPALFAARWDAIELIAAARRAVEYNHGLAFSGSLAKYRRAK